MTGHAGSVSADVTVRCSRHTMTAVRSSCGARGRQRGLERRRSVARQVAGGVFGVHEHMRPCLQLGRQAKRRIDAVRTGAPAGDDLRPAPGDGQSVDDRADVVGPLGDGFAPRREAWDVLLHPAANWTPE